MFYQSHSIIRHLCCTTIIISVILPRTLRTVFCKSKVQQQKMSFKMSKQSFFNIIKIFFFISLSIVERFSPGERNVLCCYRNTTFDQTKQNSEKKVDCLLFFTYDIAGKMTLEYEWLFPDFSLHILFLHSFSNIG